MATGTQAVERIAEATGTPVATVDRFARVLKQHRPNLWSRSGQGGGKGATHVELSHLVNMALALAVADPITAAPRMVTGYRNMTHRGGILFPPGCVGKISELLFPEFVHQEGPYISRKGLFGGKEGLGYELERLVDLLAKKKFLEEDLNLLFHSGFEVRLFIGGVIPAVQISYIAIELECRQTLISYIPVDSPLPRGRDPNWNFVSPPAEAPIIRTAVISMSFLAVLAELWSDTLSNRITKAMPHANRPLSQPDVSNGTPENETAAAHPLQGTNAAAVSDQPQKERVGSRQSNSTGERENSQSSSDSAAGHSTHNGVTADDEPGDGGAYCAAA